MIGSHEGVDATAPVKPEACASYLIIIATSCNVADRKQGGGERAFSSRMDNLLAR